jgi:hypothetical protein
LSARPTGSTCLLAEAHFHRGQALQFLDRHDEALAAYDKALAVDRTLERPGANAAAYCATGIASKKPLPPSTTQSRMAPMGGLPRGDAFSESLMAWAMYIGDNAAAGRGGRATVIPWAVSPLVAGALEQGEDLVKCHETVADQVPLHGRQAISEQLVQRALMFDERPGATVLALVD